MPRTLILADRLRHGVSRINSGILGKEKKQQEAVWLFPWGDWILLFGCLLSWSEKHRSRFIYYTLFGAWLLGKITSLTLEASGIGIWDWYWDWHWEHLLPILVFAVWGWRRVGLRKFSVFISLLGVGSVELFILNKPGLAPFEPWLPVLALVVVTVFLSSSFWEMAVVSSCTVLLNQGLLIFLYGGIVRHLEFPDPLMWHLGVLFFTGMGLYREYRAAVTSDSPQQEEEGAELSCQENCQGGTYDHGTGSENMSEAPAAVDSCPLP